jgi:hypothetical protein
LTRPPDHAIIAARAIRKEKTMPESWGMPLFVLAVLVFLGWFAVGTQWNVRRGDAVLKWLHSGLPLVGERTTVRWMGSSAMELKIGKASNPFRTAETVVIFEPRDVPFLWALSRLRRRRDTLIFRSQLRSTPSFELEAFDPKGWTAGSIEHSVGIKNWQQQNLDLGLPITAYSDGRVDPAVVKGLVEVASHAGGDLLRLSVRRNVPNLELHWLLPDLEKCSARDLYLKVRQLSEDILNA